MIFLTLVGTNIQNSLSPMLHNKISEKLSIKSTYFLTDTKFLEKKILESFENKIKGVNITTPFKYDILKYIENNDSPFPINTLKYTDDGYLGFNTDSDGIFNTLQEEFIFGKEVLIIGAGATAFNAVLAVSKLLPSKILILNRCFKNACSLSRKLLKYFNIKTLPICSEIEAKNVSYIFQTTSVGFLEDVSYVKCLENFDRLLYCKDIIYTPKETAFIKQAKDLSINCSNGLDVLIEQGILSYEIWFDIVVPDEVAFSVKCFLQENY